MLRLINVLDVIFSLFQERPKDSDNESIKEPPLVVKIPKNVLSKDVLGQDVNRQKRLTSKDKSDERRKSKKDKRVKPEELRYFSDRNTESVMLFSPASPVYETSPLFSKSPSIAQSLTSGDNLTPGNADSMPSPIESEDLEMPTHSVQSTRKRFIWKLFI